MNTIKVELDQDIRPLSEFRKKSADFIERVKNNKRPIVLTQHGKSAAVLVDVGEYQRMIDKMDLAEELMQAERDIVNGNVVSNDEAKKQMRERLKEWK
ncbi:MAG TPA: type II toxin-antitoxin system Phd/YefM family antitoxin [Gracilimonas sp.]|uniref:type II toxin-antitoxin system Phd/YefM family antitoxin n=1 Tax=Gracilimonas sp. TaxID=1974203 RepID=UPI002D8AAC25|nr:type II toxin-antitoxin system Phd/YefM family antitoxin [Gracilimonas sp.]